MDPEAPPPAVAMSLVCGPVDAAQEVRQPPIWETPMQHGGELVRKLLDAAGPKAWSSTSIFRIANPAR